MFVTHARLAVVARRVLAGVVLVVAMGVMPASAMTVTFDVSGFGAPWTVFGTETLPNGDNQCEVSAGVAFGVRMGQTGYMYMGSLVILDEETIGHRDDLFGRADDYYKDNYTITSDGYGNFTVKIELAPVTFDMGGYQGGWYFSSFGTRLSGSQTFALPKVFDGLWVGTPGIPNMDKWTYLGRDNEGNVSLSRHRNISYNEVGSNAGLVLDPSAPKNTFQLASENLIRLDWSSDLPDGLALGCSDGIDGTGGNTGFGELLTGPGGTYAFLPGEYYVHLLTMDGTCLDYIGVLDIPVGAGEDWTPQAFSFTYAGQAYSAGFTPNVPEPATMSLLALGGLALLRRRR